MSNQFKSRRNFGIELETSYSDGACSMADSRNRVAGFNVGYDCSISGNEFQSEILNGKGGLDIVREFCGIAEQNDWEVDDACGFHLHMNMNQAGGRFRRAVLLGYCLTQDFWFRLVDPERVDNSYCYRLELTAEDIVGAASFSGLARRGDKFEWMNYSSVNYHGTFENRLHEGTLDANEVCNWIKANLKFTDKIGRMTHVAIREMFEGKSIGEQAEQISNIWGSDLTAFYKAKARRHSRRDLFPVSMAPAA